jgi:hypothetical protein
MSTREIVENITSLQAVLQQTILAYCVPLGKPSSSSEKKERDIV